MKTIILGVGEGKTTQLLQKATNFNGYIVCIDKMECSRIFERAKKAKFKINFPITFDDFIAGDYYSRGVDKFHIDNADMLLQRISDVPIENITLATKTLEIKLNSKKWKHYFICKGEKEGESNCGEVFFNDDDNVCTYCGSKNTKRVLISSIEILDY